jgi:hypothetical protein
MKHINCDTILRNYYEVAAYHLGQMGRRPMALGDDWVLLHDFKKELYDLVRLDDRIACTQYYHVHPGEYIARVLLAMGYLESRKRDTEVRLAHRDMQRPVLTYGCEKFFADIEKKKVRSAAAKKAAITRRKQAEVENAERLKAIATLDTLAQERCIATESTD